VGGSNQKKDANRCNAVQGESFPPVGLELRIMKFLRDKRKEGECYLRPTDERLDVTGTC
jgi:hypothetical protein